MDEEKIIAALTRGEYIHTHTALQQMEVVRCAVDHGLNVGPTTRTFALHANLRYPYIRKSGNMISARSSEVPGCLTRDADDLEPAFSPIVVKGLLDILDEETFYGTI